MPNYSASGQITALYPGDTAILFNAEAPSAPQAGMQINLPPGPYGSGAQAQVMFSIHFAASPTAVVTIQSAVVDADGNYIATSSTSTNKQDDQLSVTTNAPFLRPQLTSGSGTLTVKAYRMA